MHFALRRDRFEVLKDYYAPAALETVVVLYVVRRAALAVPVAAFHVLAAALAEAAHRCAASVAPRGGRVAPDAVQIVLMTEAALDDAPPCRAECAGATGDHLNARPDSWSKVCSDAQPGGHCHYHLRAHRAVFDL